MIRNLVFRIGSSAVFFPSKAFQILIKKILYGEIKKIQ